MTPHRKLQGNGFMGIQSRSIANEHHQLLPPIGSILGPYDKLGVQVIIAKQLALTARGISFIRPMSVR